MDPLYQAFFDEMRKIGASSGVLHAAKSRLGRRPMRVSTLLRKDTEGTLRKHADSLGNSVPYAADDPPGMTGSPAKAPKGVNDSPSREDGRDQMAIKIPGTGRFSLAPAGSNTPEEHGNF